MFRPLFPLLFCFASAALALQETWETGYSGEDATGKHVLGHWSFEKEDGLKLNGAVLNAKGRFGGALESFPGFPVEDKRHGALVNVRPLSGAFTMEMWIKPKAEFKTELRCFLLDKKYVDHTDYQWQIGEADKSGLRRMWVTLGFGSESRTIYSLPFQMGEEWQHVAFTYDAEGEGKFYRNGTALGGEKLEGYGAVAPGGKELSLGDRLGSNYGGFPGLIDEVRICQGVLSFERVAMQIIASRAVWRRMETARPIDIVVTNLQRQAIKGASLKASLGGKTEDFIVPDLAAGKSFTAKFSLNTALKPDVYELRARFEAGDYATEQSTKLQIVGRLPPRMPVIMWGAGGDEIPRLKDLGFTHFIGLGADYGKMWENRAITPPAKPEAIAKNRRMLDTALANGLEVIASLSPAHVLESETRNLRIGRDGKPYARQDICASMPDFAPFFQVVGMSVGKAYGDHPAFTSTLINTEVRDHNQVSFNTVDVEAYKKFAGAEIPSEVNAKWGVDWTRLKDFPADRVIADDHPVLKYLRWFWTVGDGWNALHTALHRGVKSTAGRNWTFFDPAVRQPSISGAGGGVDVLSHWTYTYPDPPKIGLCADQLFAMSAASGKNQRVMKMTQLIWYRSQTAPAGSKGPGELVAWEDHDPGAAYITIAPMHLKEALWTKIARPVQGIMYHGWQSLVATDIPAAYRFTNPHAAPVLKQLVKEVIEPLGPMLMEIPDVRSEVVLLESFTSQMFARRGGYGSNMGWEADVWLALQHAHVQTDVLFEETLLKGGLSGRKVLVMPYCDVLTKSVVARIADWQMKGGKIVADEFLCPGLKADFTVQSFKREKKAAEDKNKVLALAKTLGGFALPQKALCDNPEIIIRTRQFGDATYLFVINDHREAGTYVGQHGLVMENGLPSKGVLSLKTESANVYDITGSRFIVPVRGEEGMVSWPVELGPCDGKIFVIMPKPLLGIELSVPENATLNHAVKLSARISTTQEGPVKAVIPVRLDIRDPSGTLVEGSGYHAAVNGMLEWSIDLASNDDPGTWEVRVKELASGMETMRWIKVVK